ncbi:Ankyrin [Methylophaga frappieri]|uniref:Ankyrin n=1 Tax=Methylophaga frappieri (strain ATCC BAA-2434 / DSM 25690 / JAM7) TaxID=754477 RepID=I1YJT0_METFJ|nr:ankyrin repeat domain-containing protein [Methylophaga frappieri]AFJ03173.1 Ankyrin [Methylophaga frappieri]
MVKQHNASAETSLVFDIVRQGDFGQLQILIDSGVDPDSQDADGASLLMLASQLGHTDIATLLLEKGADLHATGEDGKTPLMYAAMFNQVATINILLLSGADAYAKSADGLTALGLARAMGAEAAASRLAQHVELF